MRDRGVAHLAIIAIVVISVVVVGAGYLLLVAKPAPSGPSDNQQSGGPGGGATTSTTTTPSTSTTTTPTTTTTTHGGEGEEMEIPVYLGASEFSIPSEMKSGFGIPADVTCQGYTTSAGAEDVMDWYKEQMDNWTLENEISFSPSDQPGVTVYTQHYRKGDNGAFVFAMNSPQMGGTIFGIVTGSWSSIQGCGGGGPGGGQPDGGEQFPELGSGPITFTIFPMNVSDFARVTPLGLLNPSSGHTFPTDHGGLVFADQDTYPPPYDVKAPAAGIIANIEYNLYDWPAGSGHTGQYNDYSVRIYHTNTFYSILGHISELSDSILQQAGTLTLGGSDQVNIPVQLEEVIGKCGGRPGAQTALNWWIVDENVNLTGFIHPENYSERTTHIAHFIDYCEEDMRTIIASKLTNEITGVTRTAEPLGGKIDFDQLGKLVGNWFHETTTDPIEDWEKQLAFVYDPYDPTKIRIAVGGILNVSGEGKFYQVVGNSPDPADVSIGSGMVVYRLMGTPDWGEESVTSTIIVQLVDNERIKVEGLDGHPPDPQFTSNAQYYVR